MKGCVGMGVCPNCKRAPCGCSTATPARQPSQPACPTRVVSEGKSGSGDEQQQTRARSRAPAQWRQDGTRIRRARCSSARLPRQHHFRGGDGYGRRRSDSDDGNSAGERSGDGSSRDSSGYSSSSSGGGGGGSDSDEWAIGAVGADWVAERRRRRNRVFDASYWESKDGDARSVSRPDQGQANSGSTSDANIAFVRRRVPSAIIAPERYSTLSEREKRTVARMLRRRARESCSRVRTRRSSRVHRDSVVVALLGGASWQLRHSSCWWGLWYCSMHTMLVLHRRSDVLRARLSLRQRSSRDSGRLSTATAAWYAFCSCAFRRCHRITASHVLRLRLRLGAEAIAVGAGVPRAAAPRRLGGARRARGRQGRAAHGAGAARRRRSEAATAVAAPYGASCCTLAPVAGWFPPGTARMRTTSPRVMASARW